MGNFMILIPQYSFQSITWLKILSKFLSRGLLLLKQCRLLLWAVSQRLPFKTNRHFLCADNKIVSQATDSLEIQEARYGGTNMAGGGWWPFYASLCRTGNVLHLERTDALIWANQIFRIVSWPCLREHSKAEIICLKPPEAHANLSDSIRLHITQGSTLIGVIPGISLVCYYTST